MKNTGPGKLLVIFLFAMLCSSGVFSQSPVVKVDLNMSGRTEAECNDPNYTPWIPDNAVSISKTVNGVTFTFKTIGSGTALRANWYKAGIGSPSYARLSCDGMYVDGGAAGASIQLTISGLATGTHSLMAFHNALDDPASFTFAPIDVAVTGGMSISKLVMSKRALDFQSTQSSYMIFDATAGKDVVITYKAQTSGTESVKNVYINGFELNTPNIKEQAKDPVPADGDMHTDADNGTFILKWTAAASAAKHRIYFSTDKAAVTNASASALQAEQAAATFALSGLYNMNTYYWRVDEVTSAGVVTKGNVWVFRPRHLAFPGAEGYGRFAIGGRGGKVVHVTNLNDSGEGSLRYAIEEETGPRTIVFDVSGVIVSNSRMVCSDSYVTIAGQTAPAPGICIRSAPLGLTGNDMITRFMRIQIGYGKPTTFDGMGLTGSNHSILDHSSINFAIDEQFSSRSGKNITVQNMLIAEALNAADHQNYPSGTEHGYAGSIGGDIGSFHHNLLAHNYGRNWSQAGGLDANGYYAGRLQIVNQVVYNFGGRVTDGGCKELDFINNYFKQGPGSSINDYALSMDHENAGAGMQRAYFAGNIFQKKDASILCNGTDNTCGRRETFTNGDSKKYECFVTAQFSPTYVTTQSAANAFKVVLSDCGASLPTQTARDIRLITETKNGTSSVVGSVSGKKGFPDREADAGGYDAFAANSRPANWDTDKDGLPDFWETFYGSNKNSAAGDFADANADADKDGYTELEEYLNWLAAPNYSIAYNATQQIDLASLFRGFAAPSYSTANVVGGTLSISGSKVTFTPSGCGFASFDVKATEGGFTMTRSVGIFVESNPAGSCTSLVKKAPIVSFTAPANNTSKTAPATFALTATATDADGTIAKVEFFNGTTLIGTATASGSTYSYNWTGVPTGIYRITALATDNSGLTATSTAISLSVVVGPENYVFVYDNSGNQAWTNTGNWTPAALPTAIDTAIIRTGECKIAQDFANLVRVEPNGVFRATAYATIKNIELQGGTLMVNSSNQTLGMNATITVKDSSTIRSGFNPITLFTLAGTIAGSAHLAKTDLGVLKLTATASNFTGKWFVTQDTLTVASASGLGTTGVEILSTAVLDVDIASATGALAVKTGGKLNLDANLTVQTATFDGKPIPAGTYSSTDYPAVISGAGKLVVSTCPACPIIVTQTIKLAQGWNLISINVHPADSTIATLFKGLNVLEIKDMNSYWRKDQPAFLNLLQTITAGNGYLVNMNAEGTLSITGTPVQTQNFASLPAGWSLIGCPYQTATPIAGVLGSNFLEVKDFEGFLIPNNAQSTIDLFVPGKGYFIKK